MKYSFGCKSEFSPLYALSCVFADALLSVMHSGYVALSYFILFPPRAALTAASLLQHSGGWNYEAIRQLLIRSVQEGNTLSASGESGGITLPVMIVNQSAFDHNVRTMSGVARAAGKTIRLATKVRSFFSLAVLFALVTGTICYYVAVHAVDSCSSVD